MFKVFHTFFVQSLRHGWPAYLIVLGVFVAGVTVGSLGVGRLNPEQTTELSSYMDRFVQQAGSLEIEGGKASSALLNDAAMILAVYVLGLTVIGIPVMLGLVFSRGFILGFAVDFLTRDKALQGMALILAAVFPQNFFLVPALLIGGVASLSFSVLLARRFYDSGIAVWPGFVGYSGLMLVAAAVSACAGAVEVYLTPALIRAVARTFF